MIVQKEAYSEASRPTSTRWHFAFGAMLSYQRNPCTDCKSAPKCTTIKGTTYHSPPYVRIRAVVWECGERQTDRHMRRHTDGRDQYTFRIGYASREM